MLQRKLGKARVLLVVARLAQHHQQVAKQAAAVGLVLDRVEHAIRIGHKAPQQRFLLLGPRRAVN